ncbi:ras GEF [Sistotremastrum suecicum HHB10207 ss-3]|uniref:Ras GEF n=1 Tax=Sistotremastrum suecicum HHB10207 ss-3 TaxID=1314776 RepID=A0A165ZSA0_9AGAM|nr:ras GEF [Sistotremastrum suecicum HHB10207 ss-3]
MPTSSLGHGRPSLDTKFTISPHRSSSPDYSSDEHDSADSPQADEFVIALHDFVPVTGNATCLSFRAGQIIRVFNKDSTGWWDGELEGSSVAGRPPIRGWFPSNYVSTDTGRLMEEEPPGRASLESNASWASSRSASEPSSGRFMSSNSSSSSPLSSSGSSDPIHPLLQALLHGLSLLQAAVRGRRTAHFQPSAACILSCVRNVLSETGCLARNSRLLLRHPQLLQARKSVLSDLAALVGHSKRAAGFEYDSDWDTMGAQDEEMDEMLRTAGLVFGDLRRFLQLFESCTGTIAGRARTESLRSSSASSSASSVGDVEYARIRDSGGSPDFTPNGNNDGSDRLEGSSQIIDTPRAHIPAGHSRNGSTRSSFSVRNRTRSSGELHRARADRIFQRKTSQHFPQRSLDSFESTPPLPPKPFQTNHGSRVDPPATIEHIDRRHHRLSVSSVSTSSSSASACSSPPTPPLPTGPCTNVQVLSALRSTHDSLLSTIAAFIGHVHSHSRNAHSTSKGHLMKLAKEIVDRVRMVLTIVESIASHPEASQSKLGSKVAALNASKASLFTETSELVRCIKRLTALSPMEDDEVEEDQRQLTLQSATGILRTASDCVATVKMCLVRPHGERPFIIRLPTHTEPEPEPDEYQEGDQSSYSIEAQSDDYSDDEYGSPGRPVDDHEGDTEVEEPTVQQPRVLIDTPEADSASSFVGTESLSLRSREEYETEDEEEVLSRSPKADAKSVLTTPSIAPTDDDATTWEGGRSTTNGASLEDKIFHGDLPSVPSSAPPTPAPNNVFQGFVRAERDPRDIAYNSEGLVVGASLRVLIEKMTPHDAFVDASFSNVFFLTFRFFASPEVIIDELIARFDIWPPASLSEEELPLWSKTIAFPVRLRVSNFVKIWLEIYWRADTDVVVLPKMQEFVQNTMAALFPGPSARILDLIRARMKASQSESSPSSDIVNRTVSADRLKDMGAPVSPVSPSDIPRPNITKGLFNSLRTKDYTSVVPTDFDSLELARQLTIMESALYRAVTPDEVLEVGRPGAPSRNVKAVTTLSTGITGWVTECILSEFDLKKRVTLLKFFVKLAHRCMTLNNFSTPRAILAAIESSAVVRLEKSFAPLPQKQRQQLEGLRKLAEYTRNCAEYRHRLRNTTGSAVPFLGLYLSDVTFCREGNPSHRASPVAPDRMLINFNKYHKLARIIQDMQRFQRPFTLKEIPEVQHYLTWVFDKAANNPSDLQDLYRRSLLLEPRQTTDVPPTGEARQLFGWASRLNTLSSNTAPSAPA